MPSSTSYEPGAVVAVRIRFSDGVAAKRRPVVVLTDELYHTSHADAIVVALTTVLNPMRFGDYAVVDIGTAGLPLPSKAKGFLYTIDRRTIEKTYGRLSVMDLAGLRSVVRQLLSL